MLKYKTTIALAGIMALLGMVGGTAVMVSAQSASTTAPTTTSVTTGASSSADTPESPNDPADTVAGHGHAPLGGDGVVSSISGTTVVIGEEADEGGATYTVDASKATVTDKTGASVGISGIKVGDKVFVQGVVNGTSVSATSISLGHPGMHGHDANDTDGNAAGESSETSTGSDSSDQ